MRTFVCTAAIAAIFLTACDSLPTDLSDQPVAHRSDNRNDGDPPRYRVTIENLTSGQPLSPGVIATHTANRSIFGIGRRASEGIRLIAENGDPSTAVADLTGQPGFVGVVATPAPVGCVGCPGPFGSTLTIEVEGARGATHLSLALMLICSNDGFAGLSRVRLPNAGKTRVYHARAFDSGTERNDELWNSIVDPCGGIGPVAGPQDGTNDHPATVGRIHFHSGIAGGADLTPEHGWTGPIARVTIEAM